MTPTPTLKMRISTNQFQDRAPNTDPYTISRSILERGIEHRGAGAAACGLAALNFARIAFSMEQANLPTYLCAEEATSICTLWSGNAHLEVEEVCKIPVFEKTLRLRTTTYGLPGVSVFKTWLTDLKNIDSSAVTIITRPPEIVACLKLRLTDKNVFIIFDSHPRPSYPNGAGMIASTSIESTARRLTELLPTVDLPDGVLQWQAQLLSNCSGHVFVPHGADITVPMLWQAVLESSLAQLSMQTVIADLRSQNEAQTNEHNEAEERHRRQESQFQLLQSGSSRGTTHNARFPTSPKYSSPTYQSPRPSSSKASTSGLNDFSPPPLFHKASTSATNNFASSSSPSSSRSTGLRDSPRSLPTPPLDNDDDYPYALQLQRDFEAYDRVAIKQRPELSWAKSSQPSFDSLSHALQLQREFDAEDSALAAQRAELSQSIQRLFECGICMEEMPEDSKACPDSCGHPFCRDCLRGHVSARLEEHRFPILCPTCTAGKGKGKGVTGEVSQAVALNLGLTEEQYNIWTEMEMIAFSVLLSCRKCQRSMFVARDEHEEAQIIACPLPDCSHIWCKQCQQTIELGGPKHSCDGTLELDHLMRQQGWKHCPTCKTPILKTTGCNHMSCITPACNTHFCYICGKLIARSGLGREVKDALSNHYATCALFEVPVE
ncbi:hypothetical protein BGW80DRAFT_1345261 [Lactifluus volemus]|nr:hypothetical protein BGW80DRAFT_1345261 [Lactifluus volemus]